LIHSVQKNLNEHGEKLDEKTKTEVSDALEAAKKGTTQDQNPPPSLRTNVRHATNLGILSSHLLISRP
jgi:molecular chaperone DnaK (HSP70)